MSKPDDPKGGHEPKKYVFFVGKDRYETDQAVLTGAQIKAKVPNWPAGYQLMLEGDPDRLIADGEEVSLAKDHGPLRFTQVPPATYGA